MASTIYWRYFLYLSYSGEHYSSTLDVDVNSQGVYEDFHCCNEEEYNDAAAEGCSTSFLLLWGVVLLQLCIHKTQRCVVDLMILHSVRNTQRAPVIGLWDVYMMEYTDLKHLDYVFKIRVNIRIATCTIKIICYDKYSEIQPMITWRSVSVLKLAQLWQTAICCNTVLLAAG